jgi:hypothetical protein
LLPRRADPVAGALLGTIVLGALIAFPVLIVALIVWLVVRAAGTRSSPAKPDVDDEFGARFHELEEGILDANATKRPEGSRRRRRPASDQ